MDRFVVRAAASSAATKSNLVATNTATAASAATGGPRHAIRGVAAPAGWIVCGGTMLKRQWRSRSVSPGSVKKSDRICIAGFDFDDTLVGRHFDVKELTKAEVSRADLAFPSVGERLSALAQQGFRIAIFSNEALDHMKSDAALVSAMAKKTRRVEAVVSMLMDHFGVTDVDAAIATSYDEYRKPSTKDIAAKKPMGGTGMWRAVTENELVDTEKSFYVGDGDGSRFSSDADLRFAKAVGVEFIVAKDFFRASSAASKRLKLDEEKSEVVPSPTPTPEVEEENKPLPGAYVVLTASLAPPELDPRAASDALVSEALNLLSQDPRARVVCLEPSKELRETYVREGRLKTEDELLLSRLEFVDSLDRLLDPSMHATGLRLQRDGPTCRPLHAEEALTVALGCTRRFAGVGGALATALSSSEGYIRQCVKSAFPDQAFAEFSRAYDLADVETRLSRELFGNRKHRVIVARSPVMNPVQSDDAAESESSATEKLRACYASIFECAQKQPTDAVIDSAALLDRATSQAFPQYKNPADHGVPSPPFTTTLFAYFSPTPSIASRIFYSDPKHVVVYDAFPKSSRHLFILSAALSSVDSLFDLKPAHLDALRELSSVAESLAAHLVRSSPKTTFRFGFHALPSLRPLHLHVISDDNSSEFMKTPKHWNSFNRPELFVDLSRVLATLSASENAAIPAPPKEQLLLLEKSDPACPKCGFRPSASNAPTRVRLAKEHVQACGP